MNKEQKIINEVEKTINIIDSLPRLNSNPFLLTRIKPRLNALGLKQKSQKKVDLVLKPVTAALILALNIITLIYFIAFNLNIKNETSLVDMMKKEYRINETTSQNF